MRIKWFSLVRITGLVLVLLYHFFQVIFPGGFIGVDIFFTFSGFLITSLLIDEYSKNHKIDILSFFKRRFYRIFPPLVFMILVMLPFTFLVREDFIAGIGTQIAAAIGFVTNFYEILSGGNYESQFVPHLLVHTWSLALEVHYYLLWGLLVWYMSKRTSKVGRLKGMIFLVSTGLFLLSFLSMMLGSLFAHNYSNLYFSTFTHIFPFFLGSALATIAGIQNLGSGFRKMEQSWSMVKTLSVLIGSFLVLILLTFFLKFDSTITYLIGFLIATVAATAMILATRILHDKTPDVKEPKIVTFIADTSYGVYLFHWPFYIIFSQVMGNLLAVLLTLCFSFIFAALSFYLLEPTLAGKHPKIFNVSMDTSKLTTPIFYLLIPLTLVTFYIMATAPKVGDFEQGLIVNALNQADTKMQLTRSQADSATATEYNVTAGATLIGDSVALRASEWLQEVIPGIQVDAAVSRNLDTGQEVFNSDVSNSVLQQDVVIALGTNSVDNYEELLNRLVDNLPKGHRLIFVTPYDGRVVNDPNDATVQTRDVELALADKYDFVFVADWYQTAIDNPDIWLGTDQVHFGSDAATIEQGGRLYAQTVKAAIDQAQSSPVKP